MPWGVFTCTPHPYSPARPPARPAQGRAPPPLRRCAAVRVSKAAGWPWRPGDRAQVRSGCDARTVRAVPSENQYRRGKAAERVRLPGAASRRIAALEGGGGERWRAGALRARLRSGGGRERARGRNRRAHRRNQGRACKAAPAGDSKRLASAARATAALVCGEGWRERVSGRRSLGREGARSASKPWDGRRPGRRGPHGRAAPKR